MITLLEMSQPEYFLIKDDIVQDLANALIEIGRANEENALIQALYEQNKILSNGVETEGHYIYTIFSELNGRVGYIWFGITNNNENTVAYIYDVKIFTKYQGNGFGKKAMIELENIIKNKKIVTIELHTLKSNKIANAMYHSLGFKKIEDFKMSMIFEKVLNTEKSG